MNKAFCSTEYGQVYYWTTGKGPPLLLLHQASQSSAECLAIASFLAEHFTLVSLDYPGHGFSDDPQDEPGVEDFASVAITVLDELSISNTHVCGHHSGGLLAMYLAVEHAPRILSAVISGIGIRTEDGVRAVLDRPMSRDLPIDEDGQFIAKTWNIYRQLSSPGIPVQTTWEFFIVGLQARSRPYDAHFPMLRWERDAYPGRLTQPTLLLHGEHDSFAEKPEEFVLQFPECQLVKIPGGGPFLFYEKPAECAAAILEFVAGQ